MLSGRTAGRPRDQRNRKDAERLPLLVPEGGADGAEVHQGDGVAGEMRHPAGKLVVIGRRVGGYGIHPGAERVYAAPGEVRDQEQLVPGIHERDAPIRQLHHVAELGEPAGQFGLEGRAVLALGLGAGGGARYGEGGQQLRHLDHAATSFRDPPRRR
jgi:hypothetical protein